jgi:NhaP-type Na+/H+ or K+/H+ antiporter
MEILLFSLSAYLKEMISEKLIAIGLLVVSMAGLMLCSSGTIMNNSNQVEAQQEQANNTIRVEAGGGSRTEYKLV